MAAPLNYPEAPERLGVLGPYFPMSGPAIARTCFIVLP